MQWAAGRPAAVAKRGELRSAQWASQWGGGMEEQIYLLFDIGGTSVKYAAGDGAGVTRGLAQAGASGVQAARAISKRLK